MSFSFALTALFEAEGGYSDHPDDTGGKTRFGVTERLARAYGYEGEMRLLPRELAEKIYRDEFWNPLRLYEIESRFIAAEVLDTAVNMGPYQGARILQEGANLMGAELKVDGIIGDKTLAAVNGLIPRYEKHLYQALNGLQFVRYLELYKSNPTKRGPFIRGWMVRLARFPEMNP